VRRYSFRRPLWKFLIGALDSLGDFLAGNKRKHRPVPSGIKKILLVRLDHMGDGVLLLPLVKALRAVYPEAELSAVLSPEIAQVFEGSSYLKKVWVLKKHWLSRLSFRLFSREILGLISRLRREDFDLGLDPRGDLRTILFLSAAHVRFLVSYGSSGGGFLLHRELEEIFGEHEVDRNLRVLTVLEQAVPQMKPGNSGLVIGKVPEGSPAGPYAAIHSGAGTSAKQWPLERWKGLVEYFLVQQLIVVLLGKEEAERELAEIFNHEPRVWSGVGNLTLAETWAVIQKAQIFVGGDSGLAHGAGVLGVNTVVLESGTNDSERWGVRGLRVRQIRFPVFCSPCHLVRCRFKTHDCMEGITLRTVQEAARSFLVTA